MDNSSYWMANANDEVIRIFYQDMKMNNANRLKEPNFDVDGGRWLVANSCSNFENSNLGNAEGIPAPPFSYTLGNTTSIAKTIDLFSEKITDWHQPRSTNITQEIVNTDDTRGNVLQYVFAGDQSVSKLKPNFIMDLSAYSRGVISFDFKLIKQPNNSPNANWYYKVDCGWPCGTGDVALNKSNEGHTPELGVWQTYTVDIEYLTALTGGIESNATPLNLNNIVSPVVLFPTWGNNQQGAIYQLDNVTIKARTNHETN
ncbi:hypothetical protein [Thalassotalea agariperforans]